VAQGSNASTAVFSKAAVALLQMMHPSASDHETPYMDARQMPFGQIGWPSRNRLLAPLAAVLLLGGASLAGLALVSGSGARPGVVTDLSSTKDAAPIVNTFGLSLLEAVYSGSGAQDGVLLSPLSLMSALGMVALGTTNQGKAQDELLQALALNAHNASLFFSGLQQSTASVGEGSDSGIQLRSANSMWCRSTIKDTYIHAVHESLGATAKPLPSVPAPINDWCSKATDGMIPSILDSIDPVTVAILVNAVYFRGVWSTPFEKHLSQRSFFTPASGTKRPCTMMKRTAKMLYTEFEGVQVVELPYGKGKGVVATVLLPPRGDPSGLAELVTKFGKAGGALTLESRLSQLRQTRVALQLPRFRMEFGVHDMKQELMSSFGVREVFDGNGAFLAMSDDRDVHVSSLLHKAAVEVTEEGTTAAAVTAGVMMTRSAVIFKDPPVEVIVDRPFLFLIRNKDDGLLLFAGAVSNPSFD